MFRRWLPALLLAAALPLHAAETKVTYGPELERFNYAYPVGHFSFVSQGKHVHMAYIDVKPAKPNGRTLVSWGALRDGREYPLAIASIDICQNSELVKKHTPKVMEQVYYRLWEFLKARLDTWEGRIWSWAGDGGILAFRGEENVARAVSCCLEILASLSVFNMQPDKPIKDAICFRIALDFGPLKFFSDTGKIVSEVINYAAHLEKKGTKPSKLSISDEVHARLSPAMQKMFDEEMSFEGRVARTTS